MAHKALFLMLSLGTALGAQPTVDDVEEAKALYGEARFGEAIAAARRAVEQLGRSRGTANDRQRLADACLYMALSQLGLDDRAAAKASFKAMLRADSGRRLDPEIYAPKAVTLLEEARAEMAGEPRPAAALAPAPAPRRSKTALIALGAVAALGGGLGLSRLATNDPPVAGSVVISPPGTALMAVSRVSFSAAGASDPNGDRLTYRWDFGDGESASEPTPVHVYPREGTFSVVVRVSDGHKEASATGTVVVRGVTGLWTWRAGTVDVLYQVTQTSTSASGQANNGNRFTVTLSEPRNVTMVHTWAGCPTTPRTFPGTLDESLTTLTLDGLGCPPATTPFSMVMRR